MSRQQKRRKDVKVGRRDPGEREAKRKKERSRQLLDSCRQDLLRYPIGTQVNRAASRKLMEGGRES